MLAKRYKEFARISGRYVTMKDKIRKTYRKPSITRVKLEMEEAVLQTCKSRPGDSAGRGNKWCGHSQCKTTFGS